MFIDNHKSEQLFLQLIDHLLIQVAHTETGVGPEDLLLRFPEMVGDDLPVIDALAECLCRGGAPAFADGLGCIDSDHHGEIELHVLDVLELLDGLGVALEDEALHSAVLLSYSLLDQLLNQETVHQLIADVLPSGLATVDGVLSYFLGDEETGGDVDKTVVVCYLFTQSCPAAERSSDYQQLAGDSGHRLNGFEVESFLATSMLTFSCLITNSSSWLLERSISM